MSVGGAGRVLRHLQARVLTAARATVNRFPAVKRVARGVFRVLPAALQGSDMGDVPYEEYRAATALSPAALAALRREAASWSYQPLVSVLVAVYDTRPEHLRACVASVLGQAYERWELCLVDDRSPDSGTWALVQDLASLDERIRCARREANGGISAATNDALAMARGEFCAILDHDDLLEPDALAEVVRVLQTAPDTDLVYTDEDKVTDETGRRLHPHFKPDWSPEMLRSGNYITHLACIRTALLRRIGGYDPTCDGSQDWDILLRLGAATDRIRHVPRVLYSWRIHERSTAQDMDTKPYAVAAQRRALEKAVAAAGFDALVEQDPDWSAYWRVRHRVVGRPLVSVVVAASEAAAARRCATSIVKRSTYPNLEVIMVDATVDGRLGAWCEQVGDRRVRCERVPSSSAPTGTYNVGAASARGEVLVLVGDHTEVRTADWIETLVSEVQHEDVGVVGCRLLYPGGGMVQHAGMTLGVGDDIAVNVLKESPVVGRASIAQHMLVWTRRDVSAVTGECLAVRREVWDEVGGYEESLPSFADVDLCLRVRDAGYRVLYTPYAVLTHHDGGPSMADPDAAPAALDHFRTRWPDLLAHDPYRNPAFAGSGSKIALTLPPRTA